MTRTSALGFNNLANRPDLSHALDTSSATTGISSVSGTVGRAAKTKDVKQFSLNLPSLPSPSSSTLGAHNDEPGELSAAISTNLFRSSDSTNRHSIWDIPLPSAPQRTVDLSPRPMTPTQPSSVRNARRRLSSTSSRTTSTNSYTGSDITDRDNQEEQGNLTSGIKNFKSKRLDDLNELRETHKHETKLAELQKKSIKARQDGQKMEIMASIMDAWNRIWIRFGQMLEKAASGQ